MENGADLLERPLQNSICYIICGIKRDKQACFSLFVSYGPRWETRTPGLMVPNLSGILFPLVYSGFRPFSICFTYSLTLLSPLFPGAPAPSVVIYVVKNASRPVFGEHSPVPGGKRFSLLCGLHCNSEQGVMQEVSAGVAAQRLSRYRQRIGGKIGRGTFLAP